MTLNIQNTKDQGATNLKVVAYGPPGSGKTTFGATFPDVLILSAESGLQSVRARGLDYVAIERWEDVEEAFKFLRAGNHRYKSVVIDSLTELQKKCNDYIVRKYPSVRRAYDDLASESDWGANIDKMRRVCRAFRDLPMHVLFIALAQDKQLDGETQTMPALSGKTLPQELCGWVDVVLYLPGPQQNDEGKTYYPAQAIPAKGRWAKVRVPTDVRVPATIAPDFSVLAQLVMGGSGGRRRKAEEAAQEPTEGERAA
jgi:hypothetical protein